MTAAAGSFQVLGPGHMVLYSLRVGCTNYCLAGAGGYWVV
jgi:hypothetical protein